MSSELSKSIFKTLAYSDIFDYPLTLDEIWRFWIGKKRISRDRIKKELKNIKSVNMVDNRWFFLKRREKTVEMRLEREKEGKKKYKIVQKVTDLFYYIPSVYLIGISGGLAMNNAQKNDDIDLFIITKKNTLFITRLFLILFLEFLGLRRKRGEKNVSDKICLNMFIDESALSLPSQKQNLYNAHEVVQMRPLFERENMYGKFIKANIWAEKFLPNALKRETKLKNTQNHKESITSIVLLYILSLSVLEFIARKIQLWSIKKHQTTEIITEHFLAFHPYDYKIDILLKYKKRLSLYEKI